MKLALNARQYLVLMSLMKQIQMYVRLLDYALRPNKHSEIDKEMAKLLLEHQADPNQQFPTSVQTVWGLVLRSVHKQGNEKHSANPQTWYDVTRLLIRHNADPDLELKMGFRKNFTVPTILEMGFGSKKGRELLDEIEEVRRRNEEGREDTQESEEARVRTGWYSWFRFGTN
jgi:hypothetical protein